MVGKPALECRRRLSAKTLARVGTMLTVQQENDQVDEVDHAADVVQRIVAMHHPRPIKTDGQVHDHVIVDRMVEVA